MQTTCWWTTSRVTSDICFLYYEYISEFIPYTNKPSSALSTTDTAPAELRSCYTLNRSNKTVAGRQRRIVIRVFLFPLLFFIIYVVLILLFPLFISLLCVHLSLFLSHSSFHFCILTALLFLLPFPIFLLHIFISFSFLYIYYLFLLRFVYHFSPDFKGFFFCFFECIFSKCFPILSLFIWHIIVFCINFHYVLFSTKICFYQFYLYRTLYRRLHCFHVLCILLFLSLIHLSEIAVVHLAYWR